MQQAAEGQQKKDQQNEQFLILQDQRDQSYHPNNTRTQTNMNSQNMIAEQVQEDLVLNKISSQYQNNYLIKTFKPEDFQDLIKAVKSKDSAEQHRGLVGIKRLALTNLPFLVSKLNKRLMALFVNFTQNSNNPLLKKQAFKILRATSKTKKVSNLTLKLGGLRSCFQLIKQTGINTQVQIIQLINNLASRNRQSLREFFTQGGLTQITNLYIKAVEPLLKQACLNTLQKLFFTPSLIQVQEFQLIKESLPSLCQMLINLNAENNPIKNDLIKLFFTYSRKYPCSLAVFAKYDLIPIYISEIRQKIKGCRKYQLGFLQRMASLSSSQIQKMLNQNLLFLLEIMISQENMTRQNDIYIRKLLTTITQGSQQQLKAIIFRNRLISFLRFSRQNDRLSENYFLQVALNVTKHLPPSLVFQFYKQLHIMSVFTETLKFYAQEIRIQEDKQQILQNLVLLAEVFQFANKNMDQPGNTLKEEFKNMLHAGTLNRLKNSSSRWIRRYIFKLMFE